MAKSSKPVPQRPYPSEFGSHTSMIDAVETGKLDNPNLVVCKDQFGFYTTEVWRVDSKQADPNRWAGSRIKDK